MYVFIVKTLDTGKLDSGMRYQVAQEIEAGRKRLRKIWYPFDSSGYHNMLFMTKGWERERQEIRKEDWKKKKKEKREPEIKWAWEEPSSYEWLWITFGKNCLYPIRMFISDPDPQQKDFKNYGTVLSSRIYDPGCLSLDPDLLHSGSRGQKSIGSRIRYTVPLYTAV